MLADLKMLYHLMLKPVRGEDHAARLEAFYAGQAADYDRFRRRLLPGRDELYQKIPLPPGGTWVDLGGGTAANLECMTDKLSAAERVYVVDLSPSLLEIARQRIRSHGWNNVFTVAADATWFRPPDKVDVVTFSYSLTMIPDWFAAVDNACAMLKPGGTIGVVDFYVSRKHAAEGMVQHGAAARLFWPAWFGCDNVFLSPDHVPLLQRRFETLSLTESRAPVPYLPGLRVPYYAFVGRKRGPEPRSDGVHTSWNTDDQQ
jgi:S-adenosylmethionine-diacylgycerolhomoserine-N-methlytransferase